jgi:hypothetical protein
MLYVRLIVAIAVAYLYTFVINKLKGLPPLKWLPNNFITGLIYNAIGIIIFLSILVWPYYKEMKMRTAGLKNIAAENDFVFHDGEFQPERSLIQSPLLQRGYRRSFSQAITGKHEGVEILLFDHIYSEPGRSGREDERCFRTVTVFYMPELHMPEFIMVKKSLGDRMLESLFGSGNIDFKTDAEFSENYALNGPDQDPVKNLFTPELRSAFTRSEKRWAAAGIDNQLVLFTDDGLDEELKPEEFVTCLEKAWRILDIIRSEIKQEAK